MQLIAHSVVPSNPMPYMHLGYISAQGKVITSMSSAESMMLFAAITTVLGVGMIAAVFFRRSLVLLLIGVVLLMCGISGWVLSRELPKTHSVTIITSPARSAQP